MNKKSLLTRFRWPLFIVIWGAGQLAGTAYLYKDTHMATIGFVVFLVAFTVAVALNTIDETENEIQ